MNFAFFALRGTFAIHQIGGTDSYMRRLSMALTEEGHKVTWIFYGGSQANYTASGIKIEEFPTFSDAMNFATKQNFNNILLAYIRPIDRIKLIIKWRKKFRANVKVHSLVFFYPDTIFKKIVRAVDVLLSNYQGVACVSERLCTFNSLFHNRVTYLPPIVPENYLNIGKNRLNNLRTKSETELPKVLFLGRLDQRKGINAVINLVGDPEILKISHWTISAIYIDEDPGYEVILDKIQNNPAISFNLEDRSEYDETVEIRVCDFFRNCDIFIQPYTNLRTTVDLPLLILEAQAAGCIVKTTLPETLEPYLFGASGAYHDDFECEFKSYLKSNPVNLVTHLDKIEKAISHVQLNFGKEAVLGKLKELVS